MVQEGDVVLGKYRVERVLGQGGTAQVVAARHVQLGHQVALKFLLPALAADPDVVTRFQREALASVQLHSEHAARVIDVDRLPDGLPFLVMEHLQGQDLAEFLAQNGPLRLDEAVEVVLHACEALAEAHKLGIVHRDLKPANLFRTTRPDGSVCIKVLDFGIAKVTNTNTRGPQLTGEGLLGTISYMAPEQIRSARDVDARCDIWALGMVFFELLAGQMPFARNSFESVIAAIIAEQPSPLFHYRPDLPPAVAEIVARCLQKDPANRFVDVAQLASSLAPFAPARAAHSVVRVLRTLGYPTASEPPRASPGKTRVTQLPFDPTQQQRPRANVSKLLPVVLLAFGAIVIVAALGLFLLHRRRVASIPAGALSASASASANAVPTTLLIKGSSTVNDRLARTWSTAFTQNHPGVAILVESTGTGPGMDALLKGTASLAAASRPANDKERNAARALGLDLDAPGCEHVIAFDAIAIMVHPSNVLNKLTVEQTRRIFTGNVTSWHEVGGAMGPITVILRPKELGAYEVFQDRVLGKGGTFLKGAETVKLNADLTERVRNDRQAITFIAFKDVGSNKALKLSATATTVASAPSVDTIREGTYLLARRLFLYSARPPTGATKDFLEYVKDSGQDAVTSEGFVSTRVALMAPEAKAGRGHRRKFNTELRFLSGGKRLDSLALEDLALISRSLCGKVPVTAAVELIGHADSQGVATDNKALSKERAESAGKNLRALCPSLTVETEGRGSEFPIADNGTEEGRAINRRVEVWLREP
ncbi:MAG: substrate-binding domain-containing protein [Myxococcales bacterium]